MPSDIAVRNGFHQTHFKSNNKRALCILYLLESLLQTPNHSTQLKTFGAYTLEHLMPKKWEKTLALRKRFRRRSRPANSDIRQSCDDYEWPQQYHP